MHDLGYELLVYVPTLCMSDWKHFVEKDDRHPFYARCSSVKVKFILNLSIRFTDTVTVYRTVELISIADVRYWSFWRIIFLVVLLICVCVWVFFCVTSVLGIEPGTCEIKVLLLLCDMYYWTRPWWIHCLQKSLYFFHLLSLALPPVNCIYKNILS